MKNFFSKSIIAFSFLVLSFFIIGKAKAVDYPYFDSFSKHNDTYANFTKTHTIADTCENAALILWIGVLDAAGWPTSIQYGDQQFTLIDGSNGTGAQDFYRRAYILVGADTGSHNITMTGSSGNANVFTVSYCNVDPDDPIDYSLFNSNADYDFNITPAYSGQPFIYMGGGYQLGVYEDPPLVEVDTANGYYGNNFYSGMATTSYAVANVATTTGAWTGGNADWKGLISLNYIAPTPTPTPDIGIFGELENTYLKFDNILNNCPVNTSCQLKYTYDTDLFLPSDYGKYYFFASSTASPQYLGIRPLATAWQLGYYDRGYIIATSSASSTEYSFFQIVPWSTPLNAYVASSTVGVWFVDQIDVEQVLDDMWATSTSNFLDTGITNRNLVCNSETWAKIDAETADWWTAIRCETGWTLLVFAQKLGNIPKTIIRETGNQLKTIFPFNIPAKIGDSFAASTSSLPVALTYFSNQIDVNGDISITIPKEWTGSSSDQVTPIWGTTVIASSTPTAAAFFGGVRAFSTYIIWITFLYFVIGLAYQLRDDFYPPIPENPIERHLSMK